MNEAMIVSALEAEFPDAVIEVDLDGSHCQVMVISTVFAGLRPVACQQRVYAPLGEFIKSGALHAVNIIAKTPYPSLLKVDHFIIRGRQPLDGRVQISGAKNAALPILAATLLTSEQSTLSNVPHLNDITTMVALLGALGADVSVDEAMQLTVSAAALNNQQAPYELVCFYLAKRLKIWGSPRVSGSLFFTCFYVAFWRPQNIIKT